MVTSTVPKCSVDVAEVRRSRSVATIAMSVTSRARRSSSPGRRGAPARPRRPGRARRRRRSRPGAGRRRPWWTVECDAAASTVPSSRPVAASTTRTGAPPVPRRCRGRGRLRAWSSTSRSAGAAAARAGRGRRQHARAASAPKSGRSSSVSGSSAAAAAQVRREHVRVVRVEHGRLDRPAEQRLRVVHQVGVQRVVAGHEAPRARPARRGPARPACCHSDASVPGQPASSTASRPATSTPSSSALVRGDARAARRSAAPPRGRAAPPAGSPRGTPRPGRRARGRPRPSARRAVERDHLGAAAGPDEGQRAGALDDQVGQQVGGLGGRPTAAPARRARRASSVSGGSHSANAVAPRGERVVGDRLDVQAGQPARRSRRARPTVAEASTNDRRTAP